jgi:multidrug resistance efflux pump
MARSGAFGVERVRVRGMNAALAGRPQTAAQFPHASYRQLGVAILLLVVAGVIGWFTFEEVASGPKSFTGAVQSPAFLQLDFPQTARVVQILVKPGQHVTKGETLATQDLSAAQVALTDAKAVLAADRAVEAALKAPTILSATQKNLGLQIAQAQTELTNAQKASADAVAQGTTEIAQAEQTLTDAQSTVQTDTTAFAVACPNGTTPPPGYNLPVAPGQTLPYSPQQLAEFETCLTLSAQKGKDTSAVTDAQANLAHTESVVQQVKDSAAAVVSTDQVELALSQSSPALASQAATSAQLATAGATVATAQAQVDQDQALVQSLILVAPVDGTVADVGGTVGDLDGATGVHGFLGPTSSQSSSGGSFSLFPATPSAASSGDNQTEQEPLVSIANGATIAVAQVSEKEASQLNPGQVAHVTVNALSETVGGTVEQVVPIPVRQNGSVEYDVRVSVPSWPKNVVNGMSLSVTFG